MVAPSIKHFDLRDGSEVLYLEKFLDSKEACINLEKLDKEIPWVRPTLMVYGRKCEQPRETCYVADEGLPTYKYSGYQPVVYKWNDFPALKSIADAVHKALPDCVFNSVLLNRYSSGSDYAGWHSDDEKVYGSKPTIASVTLGKEREFLIRKKKSKKTVTKIEKKDTSSSLLSISASTAELPNGSEVCNAFDMLLANAAAGSSTSKRKFCTPPTDIKVMDCGNVKKPFNELYSFMLKNGSLLVMRGYMQRDWEHSVPRRKRVDGLRINLTFRYIVHGS